LIRRTASVALRAEFANPQHRLLPGGNVTVFFRPQQLQESPMIPAAAVQQDAQGFYSWVLTADNTVTMRRLRRRAAGAAVRGGRAASGRARMTDGAQRLRDGAAVQVLN
jgi:hypothetical protein